MPDTVAEAQPKVELDEAGKKLQLEAEKAKYLETIAKSRKGAVDASAVPLSALVPAIPEAPKGEVTLGDKAGAFGPWRAHKIIDEIADRVAVSVCENVRCGSRILVLSDRSVLRDDWAARQVRATLGRLKNRLTILDEQLTTEAAAAPEAIAQLDVEGSSRRNAEESTVEIEAPIAASKPAAATAGALGAAIDLFGLLRTDYTVTANVVAESPMELATLTAARLATEGLAKGLSVEAGNFSTMRGSPTTKRWKALLKQRDLAAQNVLRLQAAFAPIEAELASIKSRLVLLEGMCATEKDKVVAASLRTAVDRLAEQAARRERVTGAARTLAGHALNVIADTDAALASLLLTSEGSESPLFRAARYERLDSQVAKNRITHVLYVNLDALAADTVTRRSILGTSGRLRFLSSGNASWLLLKTSTGTIRAGGQVSLADVMTFGLEQGTAQFTTTGGGLKTTEKFDDDPLSKLESWSKRIIVALVVVLLVVGVLSAVSVAAALLAALN